MAALLRFLNILCCVVVFFTFGNISPAAAVSDPTNDELIEADDSANETTEMSVDDELLLLERELLESTDNKPEEFEPLLSPIREAGASVVANMNPYLSFIANFALAWFSDTPRLTGGHDPSGVGFNLQGLELAVSASVDPFFRFDSYIVLSLYGLEIEEIYGTTLALPWYLQARVGQYLTQFGRINPTHLHAWNFATQPLIIGKFFGGESLRGLGVEVSQLIPLPWYAKWIVSTQNIAGAATGRSFLPSSTDIESLHDLTLSARLEQFWQLGARWDLLFGINGVTGPNATGRNNASDVFGADLLFKWNPAGYREAGWQSEALLRRRQVPGEPGELAGDVLQDFGGYTEMYWTWSLAWRLAGRYEFVSGVDNDYLDPEWNQHRHRTALSLSYLPSHFSRLRLQYEVDWHSPMSNARAVHMIFTQLELVTGAHGAHAY